MANITVTTAANFIPELWANRALEVLRSQIVMARLVARDTDVDSFQVGDILHIPYPGTFTANDKAANTNVTLQTPAGGAEVQVALNKHKEVSFIIEDVARAQANQDIMDRYINAAVPAIAEAVESDLLALYADVDGTTTGTTGTDLSAATLRATRKALNDAKAPQVNRNIVVATKDEISLLADTDLKEYLAFSRPQAVADANLGRAYGFDIWMSQLVPVVTGTPNSTKNIAFVPDAFMLAMRGLPEPPAGIGAQAATMRDPESGLVLRVLHAYNPAALGIQVTIDVLYGVKTIRPEKAIAVLS